MVIIIIIIIIRVGKVGKVVKVNLKEKKTAERNQSQIVDLACSFQTVLWTPRNSEKKCIFGPVEVSRL